LGVGKRLLLILGGAALVALRFAGQA